MAMSGTGPSSVLESKPWLGCRRALPSHCTAPGNRQSCRLGEGCGASLFKVELRDVDVILASGSPFVAFRLAKQLAERFGRPYVLDYRDPWTGNPHDIRPSRLASIKEEASLIKGCAAVTIVSPSWGVSLDQAHSIGAKLHVITEWLRP